MPLHHPALLGPPKQFGIAGLFNEVVPRVLALRRDLARHLSGRFSFALKGPGGGNWTVDLAEGEVRSSFDPTSTLVLCTGAANFQRLLLGRATAAELLQDPETSVQGDLGSLSSLLILLS